MVNQTSYCQDFPQTTWCPPNEDSARLGSFVPFTFTALIPRFACQSEYMATTDQNALIIEQIKNK